MKSVKDVLKNFDPISDRYLSREYQSFGIHLSEKLDDPKHKSMYIKFAKTIHRPILEKALSFVSDAKARNKAALFMWKIKELGGFKK